MKKIKYLAIALLCLAGLNVQAQDEMQKVEQKIEYILKKVELEGEKAAIFRDSYQRFMMQQIEQNRFRKEENRQLKDRLSDQKSLTAMDENEARSILIRRMDDKQRQVQMESDFVRQQIQMLGAKTLLQIQLAENEFEQQYVELGEK